MFWGLTPALDLLDHIPQTNDEINVLLVGSSDCRHVLQTLAKRHRHASIPKINFYIIEATMEVVARQILLLNLALQDEEVMGLKTKVTIFMELFGNTLVRPSVAKYLTSTAKEMVKMITDSNYLEEKMPFIVVDLKYKERDYLENLFKFWCSNEPFDICESWDKRLRKTLGVRYDSKIGAFDWDLHMRLHGIGAHQICNQEYRNFRMNGVAFNWLESEVSKPNRSLVCVVAKNGEEFLHYGYLGDMQTGPFVAFGLQCEDKEYLKSTHGQNLHRATDVTERNLSQIFYELQFGKEYQHQTTNDLKLGPIVMNFAEKKIIDVKCKDCASITKNKCFNIEGVRIKFITISALERMKYKFCDFFDLVWYGCFYAKFLSRELLERVIKPAGILIVENQKFVVSNRDKHLKEFSEQVEKVFKGGLLHSGELDPCKDCFFKYAKEK